MEDLSEKANFFVSGSIVVPCHELTTVGRAGTCARRIPAGKPATVSRPRAWPSAAASFPLADRLQDRARNMQSGQRIRRSDAAFSVVNQQGPGDGQTGFGRSRRVRPQKLTTTATELAPRTSPR